MSVLLLLFFTVSASADDGIEWLDRMSHSFRELSYQGTFSYQQGDQIQSLRIAHAVIDGEEYERLEHLDGDHRDVIRHGHKLSCIHAGHRLIRGLSGVAKAEGLASHESEIGSHYQLAVVEKERVAAHQAVTLSITPVDDYRYGYRLSLDEASGLLLRSEILDQQQHVLERFQFVELSIGGDIPKSYFNEDVEHSYHVEHDAADEGRVSESEATPQRPWLVGWLPPGFTPIHRADVVNAGMEAFTDGLAVFSVFLDPNTHITSQSEDVGEGVTHQGATTAYFKIVSLMGAPYRVTVVGEIPARTAEQVAQSVSLVSGQ